MTFYPPPVNKYLQIILSKIYECYLRDFIGQAAKERRQTYGKYFIQDKYLRYYDYRPFRYVWLNKIVGNGSKVSVAIANITLPWAFKRKRTVPLPSDNKFAPIVCLTSFPTRIGNVWKVVECMFRQSILPQKIVLYLSSEQFPDKSCLPRELLEREGDMFEIKLKDGDIRSHKKYWYAVSEFTDSPIVTIDDDIIYPSDLIENFMLASIGYPQAVPAMFTCGIRWERNELLPYSQWHGKAEIGRPSGETFFGSGGGALFPIGSLRNADRPTADIMKVCPTADDIWLNAIIRINGFMPMAITKSHGCPEWRTKGNEKLSSINDGLKKNDKQLFAVTDYCKTVFGTDPFTSN